MIYHYGDIPVPYTVMWSAEEECFVGDCQWFKGRAICQREAQGEGVPRFGRPHVMRQRRVMACRLCDICAKPLAARTAISLSNFGGDYPEDHTLTQVEPLLHAECARLSIAHCPALQRQLGDGRMRVRQVMKYRPRATIANAAERQRFVPDYHNIEPLIGEAVMDLLRWRDVTAAWPGQC